MSVQSAIAALLHKRDGQTKEEKTGRRTDGIIPKEEELERLHENLRSIPDERPSVALYLDFNDARVAVKSMHITPTYEGYLEGSPEDINRDILRKETWAAVNADGCLLVQPTLYGSGSRAELGHWRFRIQIEHWTKSAPEKPYSDQLYTLTLVCFSNKIADDQLPMGQHLSQYTRDVSFFDWAHKCSEEEMEW